MKHTTETNTMGKRATVTFHTTSENKERLEKLASATNRSKSYLSNEALERYLAEEEDFIASVHEGLADAQAGRVHSFDEVKAAVEATINKAAK